MFCGSTYYFHEISILQCEYQIFVMGIIFVHFFFFLQIHMIFMITVFVMSLIEIVIFIRMF